MRRPKWKLADLQAEQDSTVLKAIRAREAAGLSWNNSQLAADTGYQWTQVARTIARLVVSGRLRACRARAPFETVAP